MLKINLPICHECQPGRGTCHVNGVDIRDNARDGRCPQKKFRPTPTTLAKTAHGAAGLVKAGLRINRASDEMIAARQAICEGCDKAVIVLGVFRKCSICGCALAAKIRNADEKCPLDPPKW